MTANQIEYWKLQETKRHNLATESMDKPLKEAQTQYNYASIDLLREQAATQETVREFNLAGAASYYSTAALNYEKIETEEYNQNLLSEKITNQQLINEGQVITNQKSAYELPDYQAGFIVGNARVNDLSFNTRYQQFLGSQANFGEYAGYNLGTIITSGANYAKIFK